MAEGRAVMKCPPCGNADREIPPDEILICETDGITRYAAICPVCSYVLVPNQSRYDFTQILLRQGATKIVMKSDPSQDKELPPLTEDAFFEEFRMVEELEPESFAS